jgi:hypothetical protein
VTAVAKPKAIDASECDEDLNFIDCQLQGSSYFVSNHWRKYWSLEDLARYINYWYTVCVLSVTVGNYAAGRPSTQTMSLDVVHV